MNALISILAAAAAGIISACGIGGGTLLLIYLSIFTDMSQSAIQGLNLLYYIPTAAASLPGHIKNNFVRREIAVPAAVTGMICAAVTAFLAGVVEQELLRRLFGIALLGAGIRYLITALFPNQQAHSE